MHDDSIKDTPTRIAKMYDSEIFYGLDYRNFPSCTTIENRMGYDELIVIKQIEVLSLCEHHFIPFIGYAHIGYIPETKVLGLSKFNRIVDFFARRPQVQERLTEQVHAALHHVLQSNDIGVVIRAEHLCVKLRGVKDNNSSTVTSKMTGKFRTERALREEFLHLVG
jgi:GTP cyclohydrolase I